jgi:hypothetical protein
LHSDWLQKTEFIVVNETRKKKFQQPMKQSKNNNEKKKRLFSFELWGIGG